MKEKHIDIDEFLNMTTARKGFESGTESLIYKTNGNKDIFKFFLLNIHDSIRNKGYILSNVVDIAEKYPMPFLTIPKELVILEDKDIEPRLLGYTMPFIKGENLDYYLLDDDVPFKKKKELLIKMGLLLEKMKKMREDTHEKFFLNDLHEDNVIVQDKTEELKLVDMDSAYVRDCYVAPSKYLLKKDFIRNRTKYPLEKKNPIFGRQIIPSQNTEYYCYLIMILNTLLKDKTTILNNHRLQLYINHLEKLGINKEIIKAFRLISKKENNINPYPYIEGLPEMEETTFDYCYKNRKF